jgi:16S rRNA (guanine527-N7)-methyltransferase
VNEETIAHGLTLLHDEVPDLDVERCVQRLCEFDDILVDWNEYAHLVSARDLASLEGHVVDSLALAPTVRSIVSKGGLLLDIGSGGGFPAIVLKIVLSSLPMVLIERDRKKVAFLTKVVGKCALEDVRVVQGWFPRDVPDGQYSAVTARAVERPGVILPAIARFLTPDAAFVCQSPRAEVYFRDGFDLESVDDCWSQRGLRRGSLRIYRSSKSGSG